MPTRSVNESIKKLDAWVQRANWRGYDTFDGLSSPLAPFLTLNQPVLKIALQQGVRRFPLNLRPLLGIKPDMSTKGMGFFRPRLSPSVPDDRQPGAFGEDALLSRLAD